MAMTLITTNDGSGVTTSDFTSGIDSTYKLYIFKFIDVNPVTDNAEFQFQANATDSTTYDENMTTTAFHTYHSESGGTPVLAYVSANDQAGTAAVFQDLNDGLGSGADECLAGELYLFNPSSTTYVKHFYYRSSYSQGSNYAEEFLVAGYFNTATAIDDIRFKMDSGDFDAVIKMYGVG
jgi:hypothetical protein